MRRRFVMAMVVLGAVFFLASPALAAEKTHEGKVVSVTEGTGDANGKLVMTDNAGKNEHSHPIPPTTKISLNGKAAKLGDLKKGDGIKVTQDEDKKVTALAATRK